MWPKCPSLPAPNLTTSHLPSIAENSKTVFESCLWNKCPHVTSRSTPTARASPLVKVVAKRVRVQHVSDWPTQQGRLESDPALPANTSGAYSPLPVRVIDFVRAGRLLDYTQSNTFGNC